MDARIALGINPLVIPDQSESLRKAMTLQALQGQSQLQGLQLEEGQRTLTQNRAMDEAARGSTSTEDYLARLAKINPAAATKLKGDLLTSQKTQGEVYEQQSKQAQGLTAGFMSVPDAQKPQAYTQFVSEWKRMGLPGADKVPDQFSPEMIPHLTMIAGRGLAPKDVQERADYARTGTPDTASPTVAALSGAQPGLTIAPEPPTSEQFGAFKMPPGATDIHDVLPNLSATQENMVGSGQVAFGKDPSGNPVLGAPDAIQERAEAASGKPLAAPSVAVDPGKKQATPDDLRARAAVLRAQGTKAGADVAKDLDTSANQLEMRLQMEQRNVDINKRFEEREARIKSASEGADLRPEDARFIAQEILAGNQTAGAGLARNQKAKAAVIRAITDEAALQGKTAEDAAAKVAEFSGITAGQRTLGTRQANLGVAIEELKQFIPIAQAASDKVPRSNFKALNELLQIGYNQWSPEQAQFVAANRAVVNSFAQIAARGGMNVHSIEAAEHAINTAQTPEQYKAVLNQFMTEAVAAGKAPGVIRKEFSEDVAGRSRIGSGQSAPGAPQTPVTKGAGDGTAQSPFKIKGDDGYTAIKSGQFFIGPDGQLRQKP